MGDTTIELTVRMTAPRRYGYDRSRRLPVVSASPVQVPGAALRALARTVHCIRSISVRTSARICRRVGSNPGANPTI